MLADCRPKAFSDIAPSDTSPMLLNQNLTAGVGDEHKVGRAIGIYPRVHFGQLGHFTRIDDEASDLTQRC